MPVQARKPGGSAVAWKCRAQKAKGAGSLAGSRPLLSELFEDLASAARAQLPDAAVARGLRACAPAPRARSVTVPLCEPSRRRMKSAVAHRFLGTPVTRCSAEVPVARRFLEFVSALLVTPVARYHLRFVDPPATPVARCCVRTVSGCSWTSVARCLRLPGSADLNPGCPVSLAHRSVPCPPRFPVASGSPIRSPRNPGRPALPELRPTLVNLGFPRPPGIGPAPPESPVARCFLRCGFESP
jgi:hypothetical protein